jgi:hypothetical protein
MGLSACGSSKEDLEKARKQGAEEYRQKHDAAEQKRKQRELERKIKKLERESKHKSSSGSNSGSGSGGYSSGTSCGGGLSVGPNTTCSFAENVRSEWYSAGSGDVTIEVYSPVTGSTYTMSCNAGVTTVCRGGNNATVYIR